MMERSIAFVLGVWVLVSPWLFGASANSLMLWSNTLAGLALIIANLWALFGERHAPRQDVPAEKEGKKNRKVDTIGTNNK